MKKTITKSFFLTALALVIIGVALLIFGEATAILTGLVCVVLGVSIVSFTMLLRLQSAKNSITNDTKNNQGTKTH